MDIEQYLKEKKPLIDKEIAKLLPREITPAWLDETLGKPKFAHDAETATAAVAEPIWDFLGRGGKRWRPALMLLCCEAVGGDPEAAKPFVVLPELIHSGTLLVDDVEDNSEMRRGRPATHKIYGTDLAINTGNLMYYLPLRVLYKNTMNLPDSKRADIYDLYSKEMLRLSFGQAMDILWHKGRVADITEEQYLQMCTYKTGCLARFSAELAAILGNSSTAQRGKLGEFASALGVGFQIQDDILELTGKEFQRGKGLAGGDIHEGKRTLLVIKTLEKASPTDKKRLLQILDSHPTDEKTIRTAISIIEKYGAVGYAKEKAREIVENSWGGIGPMLPDTAAKSTLKSLANYCTKREI